MKYITLLSLFLIGCGHTTPREAFTNHWEKDHRSVKMLQVVDEWNGIHHGFAIADGRPVDAFYDADHETFSDLKPSLK